MRPSSTLTQVRGVSVGHAEDPDQRTGVTVLLFDEAAPTVVDVRGGASCTYDTSSLAVEATFGRRWGLFFTGGSIYGLDAARGVRNRILEMGRGHTVFGSSFPIAPVSGAALFDLPEKMGPIPDYLPLGYEAARSATRAPVRQGSVGAGAGALVGKYRGRAHAMRGGVGSSAGSLPGQGSLGVLVVLNSVGAIREPESGRWLAGSRDRAGKIVPPSSRRSLARAPRSIDHGTSLAALVVDQPLSRPELFRLAVMAQAALARSVQPTNTPGEGDLVFASCTQESNRGTSASPEAVYRMGLLAMELVTAAVRGAVAQSPP
ncbi:MAG: P1 family peptidase [Thermoplasmata archaeon]